MGGTLSLPSRFRGNSGSRANGQAAGPPGQYRYTPSSAEPYFSSHFYLGHRKFETGEPELFLFGDLQDLNYLPAKPVKFPYKQPSRSQPLRTLRSFINVQRDSIKLVKVEGSSDSYRLGFTFDSDTACKFTIMTGVEDATEVDSVRKARGSKDPVFEYGAGCEQQFAESSHMVCPSELIGEGYDPAAGHNTIPLAVLMETNQQDATSESQQALLSLCTMDNFGEDNFSIKIIKQKLLVGGMELLLQELYGLENKLKPKEEGEEEAERDGDSDSEVDNVEELGAECVICITEVRDTLLLPCRHLCLCSSCAANLRFQASNCPICRAPFRALLQIRALETLPPDLVLDDDTITGNPKYSVPGYRCVPLLQALNGYQLEKEEEEVEEGVEQEGEEREKERDGAEEEREEDKKREEVEVGDVLQLPSSPYSGSSSAEATTEFCIIHIEDGPEQVTLPPTADPIRTVLKNTKPDVVVGVASLEDMPLPGTPDPPSPTPSATEQNHSDVSTTDLPASWCSSSLGSEVSVKSTEALIAKTT